MDARQVIHVEGVVGADGDFDRGVQSAEVFKTYAESRAEEMMANEQRLKKRVSVLEDQVSRSSILKLVVLCRDVVLAVQNLT